MVRKGFSLNIDYTVLSIFRSATAAVIGLTVHEFAHAFAAYQLGDTTARDQGRLTLNPMKHLNLVGFLLIVIAGFGWAKPVSFRSENLKRKYRDEVLIALAGPLSNFVIGILFLVVARCLYFSAYFNTSFWGLIVVDTFLIWGVINFGLFVFNLIPIPPLDGSHIYTPILKDVNPGLLANLYRFGIQGLLIIIIIEKNSKLQLLPISRIVKFMADVCMNILNFHK